MTTIKLDKDDSAIIIKKDGQLRSITPESKELFSKETSFIVAIILFMLQNDYIFNKVKKVFMKKMKKQGSIPIQIDKNPRFHHEVVVEDEDKYKGQ